MSEAERLSAIDVFKGLCGVLGIVGAGVFLLIGPDEVRDELSDPLRVRAGVGLVAVGGLFLVAIVLSCQRSRLARALAIRVKGLLLAVVLSGLLVLAYFRMNEPVREAWRLAHEGRPAQAVVTKKYGFLRGGRSGPSYMLECEGHHRRLRLPGTYSEGQQVPVLRDPDDPELMLPGEPGDDFLDLLAQNPGHTASAWIAGLGLLAALGTLFGLKRFLLGRGGRP